MKLLDFDRVPEKAASRFERIHEAIILGSLRPAQDRNIEVYRREARILDALDAISLDTEKLIAAEARARVLNPDVHHRIALEQGDIDLIIRRLELPDFWQALVTRSLVDTRDTFLTSLPDATSCTTST